MSKQTTIDLFSARGGLTLGLKLSRFHVLAAIGTPPGPSARSRSSHRRLRSDRALRLRNPALGPANRGVAHGLSRPPADAARAVARCIRIGMI